MDVILDTTFTDEHMLTILPDKGKATLFDYNPGRIVG